MTLAQDMLMGCDDSVWAVAAPTACAIVCNIGKKECRSPCNAFCAILKV